MNRLFHREGRRYRRYYRERPGIPAKGVCKVLLALALIVVLASLLH